MIKLYSILILLITLTACTKTPSISIPVIVPPTSLGKIVTPIEIKNFSSNKELYGQQLSSEIKSNLLASNYVQIVSKNGMAILTGNIEISPTAKDLHERSFKDQDGVQRTLTITKIETNGLASYSLLDKQGNLISSNTFRASQDSTDTNISIPTDGVNSKHKSLILMELAANIASSISPTLTYKEIALMDGKHPKLKKGIKKIEFGDFSLAIKYWKDVILETSVSSDKSAAYYNIGLAYEKNKDYKNAYENYVKSSEHNINSELIEKGIYRVKKSINNKKYWSIVALM